MANDCCGNLRVVAKNKETLNRIFKILNCEDPEFCMDYFGEYMFSDEIYGKENV